MKLLTFIIFIIGQVAFCNDSTFMGDGRTAMPIKNNDVSMISEVITVERGVGLGWLVDVIADFKNNGPDQTVQFGFPFNVYSPGPEDSSADPEFHTSIDGADFQARRETTRNEDFEFNTVYLFPVHFQKDQTRTVHHSYTVGGTNSSTGDQSFAYILKTGAMWAHPIESIKIHVVFQRGEVGAWHCFSPTCDSVSSDSSTVTLSWSYSNIRPDFNLKIEHLGYLYSSHDSIDCETLNDVIGDTILTGKNQLRYIRNMIYAFYGYPFRDSLLRAQFYSSGRFKESAMFDESQIDPRHKKLIERILAREQ